jgi:hypothetical protein
MTTYSNHWADIIENATALVPVYDPNDCMQMSITAEKGLYRTRSITVCLGRRTGLTSFLSEYAEAGDLVVCPTLHAAQIMQNGSGCQAQITHKNAALAGNRSNAQWMFTRIFVDAVDLWSHEERLRLVRLTAKPSPETGVFPLWYWLG